MEVINAIKLFAIGVATVIASFFAPQAKTEVQSMPTLPQASEQKIIQASGKYTFLKHTTNINLTFPEKGGKVTGSLTGACEGEITGNFTGENKGRIQGQATGKCTVLFITQEAKAQLDGDVYLDERKIIMQFDGKGGEYTHNGNFELQF